MNLRHVGYRAYQCVFALGARLLPWRQPETITGPGSLAGLLKVRRAIPPFIAVPTTAGAGSETTIAAVVTGADHHKYAMNARLGIPTGFTCIREADLPQMAAWAAKEANPTYPVPVIYDRARFIRVIRQVMQ